jgi:hypothetical protein
MGIWRSHFHWSVLLGWEVLGWIVPTLLAIAGVLLFFDQYQGANVCFILASLFAFAKVAHLAITANDPPLSRILFTFLLFGLFGVGIVETVRGVNRWAASKRPPGEKAAHSKQNLEELPNAYRNALKAGLRVDPDVEYPEGTIVAGIPWRKGSILSTLVFETQPNTKLFNVELELTFNAQLIHATQVTHVPDVFIQPIQRNLIYGFAAGNLDKNGKEISRISATPDEVQTANTLPTNRFIFKQVETFQNLPVTVAFIGGSGYRFGNFTYILPNRSSWYPTSLRISGTYEVRYRDRVYTLHYNYEIHKQE